MRPVRAQAAMAPAGADRGFSLIELMAVCLAMSVIMGTSIAVFTHSVKVGVQLESSDNLKNYGQFAVNAAKLPLQQSRAIFQDDAYGRALWGQLNWSGHTPIAGTRLPVIRETGSLSPSEIGDATSPFDSTAVGNALLFTESMGHISAGGYWIDRYRLRGYYLTKADSMKMMGKSYAYDLIEWVGPTYLDYTEMAGAPGAVFSDAVAQGYTLAWNAQATSLDSTVWDVSAGGSLAAQAAPTLDPVTCHSATHVFGDGGDTRYAVAFNTVDHYPIQDAVPAFGSAHASGDGFPNGFEVMVVGPTGGRKILLRLVLVAEGYGGRYSMANTVIASSRNF